MSTALVQSIEELLLTAIACLTAELKAETDPQRLETLLALAFRARLPRTPASSGPAPSDPDRPTPRSDDPAPRTATRAPTTPNPRNNSSSTPVSGTGPSPSPQTFTTTSPTGTSPAPSTPHPTQSDDDPGEDDGEYPPLYFTELTEEEFLKLEREIGFAEANRRRIIRANLARRYPIPTPNTS